jgi:hypothetical protein
MSDDFVDTLVRGYDAQLAAKDREIALLREWALFHRPEHIDGCEGCVHLKEIVAALGYDPASPTIPYRGVNMETPHEYSEHSPKSNPVD